MHIRFKEHILGNCAFHAKDCKKRKFSPFIKTTKISRLTKHLRSIYKLSSR
jgi:hypothetical protein